MKASEILRNFADIIDRANSDSHPEGTLIRIGMPGMSGASDSELDPDPKMIPPLQQNLELLKKSVGVDSEYDEYDDDESCGCETEIEPECGCDEVEPEDELMTIRRIAGLPMISTGFVG